jgi:predicted AAA+ superfamily ATPase
MSETTDTIKFLNPWWENKKVSEELAKPYERKIFSKIKELQSYRQTVILTGLRRVGKTTLLYQTIKDLMKKIPSKNIFYFSFDKEIKSLLKLLEDYKELTRIDYKTEKIFILLDEITKLNNWAGELKLIYDSHPNIKFYISSSSSINLEEEAIKNLAGRYFLINILALNFEEFLQITNKHEIINNKKLHEKEIKEEFYNYLLRSFPETINWKDELMIKDYLKTTIIDKIIKSDLPEKFKNINKDLLYTLLELFYKEPGYYLDYDNLSKNLRISKNTLYKHIFYLEFCYLIRIIKNYRPSTLSTSRKLRRVYPYWWNLAYCYSDNKDKILESLVLSQIDGKYYWRELEKEIDIIKIESKNILPIEIKNKDKIEKRDLNTLMLFTNKFNIKKALLVYLGKEEKIKIKEKTLILMPFWNFLLNEGE